MRRPARLAERLLLLAGLVVAAALLLAAFALVHEPEGEGRAALARASGGIAEAVEAEWRRQAPFREPAGRPDAALRRDRFEWRPGVDEPLPAIAPRELATLREAEDATADALLAESRRLELLPGRADAALDSVLRALDRSPDPGRRAEARLRAIRLAARAGRADVAREQWAAARAELAGDEALDGVSVRLLGGLAVAPLLDEEERHALLDELTQAWCDGRLALPEPVDRLRTEGRAADGALTAEPALRAALRLRLQSIAPARVADEARWAADARRRHLAALAAVLGGELPAPSPGAALAVSLPAAFPAAALVVGSAEPAGAPTSEAPGALPDRALLVATRETSGVVQARFVSASALAASFLDMVRAADLLPAGFSIDVAGTRADLGPVVRGPVALIPGALEFSVRHADPEGFASAMSARARWLRGGLVAAAVFAAAAAALAARALARQRALAELRRAFVASVSHELRTPAASILLLTENLQAGIPADEPGRARYLALVRREALRLRRLVDDVLDLSRLERGEPARLVRQDVALAPFVADLAREAGEAVAAQGGRFSLQEGPLPETARLDAEAVRRAVLNLVENALRHSGSLDVALLAGAGDGALLLAVSDGGRGIPAGARNRIFEPFERLAAGGGAPGTGLGLSIVRAIAEGHGGSVRATGAVPGPGARFELRLPLAGGDEESA